MTRKKRTASKKKSPRGLIYTLLLVCAVCLGYEPLIRALHLDPAEGLPALVGEWQKRLQLPDAAPSSGNPASPLPDDVLLPALLEGTPEKILVRRGYTVSYNLHHNLPNWVAWELTTDKLVERESRTDKFLPDPDLPADVAVTTDDYKRSGWDRGHMCPAADNRWHWRAMQESFYMTNICPQHHNLNRGDWKELEDACREWAQKEGKIYIVCGPILYRQKHRTIGHEHRITVPEAFFKVILAPDSRPPRAIGFIFKNTSGNHPLDSYVNSVDQVERITGIDFFPALPDDLEEQVEADYDLSLWNSPSLSY